jgi:hypothetical protein
MGEIKPALERAGFFVAQTSFGHFSLLQFLSPFQRSRDHAINRVIADIRLARNVFVTTTGAQPERMSVISHSFGTYVMLKILLEVPDLAEWYRVIFCGSVLREDAPLQRIYHRFRLPLLNEIGSRDYLPALAESAGWDYGSVGSTGFNRPIVETRWHKGFRHSDFFTDAFCTEFWVPFLRGEAPKPADKPSSMPIWIRLIAILPLQWLPVALVICVISGAIVMLSSLLAGGMSPRVG